MNDGVKCCSYIKSTGIFNHVSSININDYYSLQPRQTSSRALKLSWSEWRSVKLNVSYTVYCMQPQIWRLDLINNLVFGCNSDVYQQCLKCQCISADGDSERQNDSKIYVVYHENLHSTIFTWLILAGGIKACLFFSALSQTSVD